MKLYYSPGACSLVVRILINELNLPCEFEEVDLRTKQTKQGKDFKQISPKGCVPTLELPFGEILTENLAIQQYLVDVNKAYNLLPEIGNVSRFHIIEWSVYVSTELHKGFSPFFNPQIPDDIKNNILKPILFNKFNYVNQQLAGKDYLFGPNLTLPDIYLFVMILWLKSKFAKEIHQWPNLIRFYDNLLKRKAFSTSLHEEGLL